MHQDQRYEYALSAALVILDEIDRMPDMPKHNRLSLAVFSILHAMDCYEAERSGRGVEFSAN
jgi:uncharacterized protein (UPF0147 family)